MSKKTIWWMVLSLSLGVSLGCDDDSDDDVDGGTDAGGDADTDTDTDTDADTDTDTDTDADTDTVDTETDTSVLLDKDLGSACLCTGDDCAMMGVPKPNGGTIVGCDDVELTTGAELGCLRSYAGTVSAPLYFANGFCTGMAVACEGAALICTPAVIGNYEQMVACPTGTVMLSLQREVTSPATATISTKVCTPACTDDTGCRGAEQDPIHNAPAQYKCIDKNAVKFCYDERNLTGEYEATQF